ncbi:MAG: HAMP domain-containing protein [Sedimentisphaerales bacterium]|nr:HAMP domain-containing protein [Sedimentisphaerales bacterium]
MFARIHKVYHRILVFLHLSPLSLAEKCRLAFGLAVVLTLFLALLIPYAWMRQLTRQILLESSRARAESLIRRHFRLRGPGESTLVMLDDRGHVVDPNKTDMRWIRFKKDDTQIRGLTLQQRFMLDELRKDEDTPDQIRFETRGKKAYTSYVRVFRATESCVNCHNPQGSAEAFNRNEPIGAVIVERPAGEIQKAVLLNRVWIAVAMLIGGVGAFVAFYIITQKVILSPVRQLRALANNVAEGNLDVRSSIKTRDEYEKLAEAFNKMLDGLQAAQEKLRQANKQLDEKIIELSERNIELFKANKVKGEFLANISHEFRTPLNSIMGFAQVLRDKPDLLKEEKGKRYAENIIAGGQRLLNMINDLLYLARAEADKVQLHIEQTTAGRIIGAVLDSTSFMAKNKKIELSSTVQENIPALVTDAGKIQQILENYMSNAVKFTHEGGSIELTAALLDDKTMRFSVRDTGCGIADADREKVFQKFGRLGNPLTRRSTGTGLGLAISKELADMLAGSVGFESRIEKGSTFWLDIPVELAKEESAKLQ